MEASVRLRTEGHDKRIMLQIRIGRAFEMSQSIPPNCRKLRGWLLLHAGRKQLPREFPSVDKFSRVVRTGCASRPEGLRFQDTYESRGGREMEERPPRLFP